MNGTIIFFSFVATMWKKISLQSSDVELTEAIRSATDGILIVDDFTAGAPFTEMSKVFQTIHDTPELGARLNMGYTKNLVYKDSYAEGKGMKFSVLINM